MDQTTLTRQQLKTAYDIFQEVSGGLSSDWIFSADSVADGETKLMIGNAVGGKGAGRTWSSVWVNIPSMRDDQLKVWEERKAEVGTQLIEEWADETTIRIGFTAEEKKVVNESTEGNANQLQGLSSEVVADPPADTEAGKQ